MIRRKSPTVSKDLHEYFGVRAVPPKDKFDGLLIGE
jgi:hypothetical protein